MTGATPPVPAGAKSASECAPQPWSSETTRPSSGAYSLAHTPKTRPSGPARGARKPHVTHGPGAARANGVPGPCSLEYHLTAAVSRPMADRTLVRRPGVAPPAAPSPAPAVSGPALATLAPAGLPPGSELPAPPESALMPRDAASSLP